MAEEVDSTIPLYVTGHSMGGVLASLFAAWYYSEYPEDKLKALVTFGSPKCMNKEAWSEITCEQRRYVINNDFAQWWPPSFIFSNSNKKIPLKPISWWPADPISRHEISGYVASLTTPPRKPTMV